MIGSYDGLPSTCNSISAVIGDRGELKDSIFALATVSRSTKNVPYNSLTYWLFFYIKTSRNLQIFVMQLFLFKLEYEMYDENEQYVPSFFPEQDDFSKFKRGQQGFKFSVFDKKSE